jgi:hypothetical protein
MKKKGNLLFENPSAPVNIRRKPDEDILISSHPDAPIN